MDRRSKIPGGISRQNTGLPCRIPSSSNRNAESSETKEIPPGIRRVMEVPDLVHRVRTAVPRYKPQTSPVISTGSWVINTAGPSQVSGGKIKWPVQCPPPFVRRETVSTNTSTADRNPRGDKEESSVEGVGNATGTISGPRPGGISAPRSMPRPTASGPSGIVRPNTFSGARGVSGGVGIPRPGGNVTALPRMPAPSNTTRSTGLVRPSGERSIPRAGGIPGVAGGARPIYSMAGPRPCPNPVSSIPGPAGEPRGATMATTRQMAMPDPRAGIQQQVSTMPSLMQQPGDRLRFNAPGSFVRPPAMQKAGGIPRRGLPRPQFTAGQPRIPIPSGPCQGPIRTTFASDVTPSLVSSLRPPIPQETVPIVSYGEPMASSTDRYQSQEFPCSPVRMPSHDIRVSPGVGGDIAVGTPVEDPRLISPLIESPEMYKAAYTRFTTGSPLKPTVVQRSPCLIRAKSPAQAQRLPCPVQEMSPVQVQRSPYPTREMPPVQVQRSPCPARGISPVQVQRSPCPIGDMIPAQDQHSPYSIREMSPAQVQHSPYPIREISTVQTQRSPCPVREMSPAQVQRSPCPVREVSPAQVQRSPCPVREMSPVQVQRSPCPAREMSPVQVQRSPCPAREMSPAQVQRSPCPVREMSPAQVQRSPCPTREMSPAQVQRSPCPVREISPQAQRFPCPVREMSPAQVPSSPCPVREVSPAQVQRSPCPMPQISPAGNVPSQSPRIPMASEATLLSPNEASIPCQEVSSTPCRRAERIPSPPIVPPDECLSPVPLQSLPRSQDTSRSISGFSDTPPFFKPPSRKRQQQLRRESVFYAKRPPYSSPTYERTPRDQRIECRMPASVSTGPSSAPSTTPSPQRTFSPPCPGSTDPRSSPYSFTRSPPPSQSCDPAGISPEPRRPPLMEGTVRLSSGKRVGWADGQPGAHPGTVTVDRWGDGYGGSGMGSVAIEQDPYDWDSSGTPPRVPAELLCPDESDFDSYQTPPTAMLRYQPSRFRPRRHPSSKIKRFQETPLSRMPMKHEESYEGIKERIFPRSHWRRLADIYEERGEAIERSASPAAQAQMVCSEGPPITIPEGAPCPPEGPPDTWAEEEDECTEEVDTGEGTTAKSRTKVRTVTKEWMDPHYKYSSRVKESKTVEMLLCPPDKGDAEDECQLGGESAVDAAAAAADECHRMAEEAAARAQEAAETASRMAMEVERAASRCSPGEEEGAVGPEEGVADGELEEICRLLSEEKVEVDLAIDLEKQEYQMRKKELSEQDCSQERSARDRSPCSRTEDESDDGPSPEVLAAMMWAEECGAPLSSDPENLFQLLFGQKTPEGEEEGPSRESILEEKALAGPEKLSRAQLRGSSVPPWFPGYLCAFPVCVEIEGRRDGAVVAAKNPGDVLHAAWLATAPDSFPIC